MESPNTFHQDKRNKGFTLIEVMIAIGLMSIILALGLFLSFDVFRSSSLDSEKEVIVSILQRARSNSLNNINQVRHGVHFETAGMDNKYILFECSSGFPQCTGYASGPRDVITTSSYGYNLTAQDIIFEQLTGDSSHATITMVDGARTYNITINSEGRINW